MQDSEEMDSSDFEEDDFEYFCPECDFEIIYPDDCLDVEIEEKVEINKSVQFIIEATQFIIKATQ
jgi:hypothetical protein